MNEPPRKEYVIRLLYTLLGRQQGVEYAKYSTLIKTV